MGAGARSADSKAGANAVGSAKSKESVVQSARPDSSRSDAAGAEYKDDFEADSRCALCTWYFANCFF